MTHLLYIVVRPHLLYDSILGDPTCQQNYPDPPLMQLYVLRIFWDCLYGIIYESLRAVSSLPRLPYDPLTL